MHTSYELVVPTQSPRGDLLISEIRGPHPVNLVTSHFTSYIIRQLQA